MNRRTKFSAIILLLLTLVIVFKLIMYIDNERTKSEIIFRKTYGNINLIIGQKSGLSLAFIVKNDNSSFTRYMEQQKKMNNLSFNTEKIIIEDFKIVKSMNSKHHSYYHLNLSLMHSDEFSDSEQVEVDTINFGGNSYYIGDLVFTAGNFNKNEGKLEVNSAHAMSLGIGLKDYSATIQNYDTDEQIIISRVDVGNFEKYNPKILFEFANGTIREFKEKVTLEPKEEVEFIVKFDRESALDYDVFYFSPLIHYYDNKNDHTLYFYYYSSGLSISDDEIKDIISKY